ncbi:unnamed protein product, partial [Mesorhabditis belari]|uniref:Serine/threonine-protein phosphatase n=1 Tax=Mesorhabditis belari TaxID=2138241 RepID=A0AAF3FCL3_9BILA
MDFKGVEPQKNAKGYNDGEKSKIDSPKVDAKDEKAKHSWQAKPAKDMKHSEKMTKGASKTGTSTSTKEEQPAAEVKPKLAAPLPPPTIDQAKLLADSEVKATAAAKKINLRDFIKKHLLEGSRKMEYDLEQVHAILDMAKFAFLKTSPLLELNAPVNICGDIHGQYGDLFRIFNSCGLPFRKKYLFLGDYVDRGRHSLEVILLLLAMRIEFPKKVYLLRGNHELANINKVYGFLADCRSRFRSGSDWKILYDHFNEIFAVMPLAAVVSNRILCMHGGLSPDLNSLDDIRKLVRPIVFVRGLAQDLLWADPEAGIQGFQVNKIRAVSHIFGEDAVAAKCKQLNIDLIIRAHQVVEYGYAFFANRLLITVFSAARYHEDLWNFAAVVKVDEKLEVSFVQLKPSEYEQYRREKQQTANVTGDNPDEEDK